MRCLTLAKQLNSHDLNVILICRNLKGNSISYLKSQGMQVIELPFLDKKNSDLEWTQDNWKLDANETIDNIKKMNSSIDLIIVDHYALDIRWEKKLRPYTRKIMVIDDLANRQHDCDLLLDQNFYLNMDERYNGLVPSDCKQLLGPNYVLLREEFYEAAKKRRVRSGKINRILVFFGGTDPTGETIKVLEAIRDLSVSNLQVDVVVGSANPRKDQIEQMCNEIQNVTFYCQVNNMAELMMKADFSIGAGGATTWERCFLGLPTLVISVANNQIELSEAVNKKRAIIYMGESQQSNKDRIQKKIILFLNETALLKDISNSCMNLMNHEIIRTYPVMSIILELIG